LVELRGNLTRSQARLTRGPVPSWAPLNHEGDTNLWIYLYSDKVKGRKVKQLVDERFESIVVSTQVLGELFHVLTKKGLKSKKRQRKSYPK
jgi:hypothetical protein